MHSNNSNGSRAASPRGFIGLFAIMLAMGLGLMAPGGGGALRLCGNTESNSVSVIDTVTNTVVATIPVGLGPVGVAVTPDGKHAYVANDVEPGTFSVIDTASNSRGGDTNPGGTQPHSGCRHPGWETRRYVANNGTPSLAPPPFR